MGQYNEGLGPDSSGKAAGSSQVEMCYALLRRQIVTCELEPGLRLNERGLIERLGFGRTPIREALLRLDQDRLIETRPRSGYRVRPLTRQSIDDFFKVWKVFAPLIAELAIEGMTTPLRLKLDKIAKERKNLIGATVGTQARIAGEFFATLVEAANNEPLAYVYGRLGAELERIFIFFLSTAAGREWLGPGDEIEVFAKLQDPSQASTRIRARMVAAHKALLAHVDECISRGEPILPQLQ